MTAAITGATGLLGPYLLAAAAARGAAIGLSRNSKPGGDLTDANVVHRLFKDVVPSLLIHAAGYTDVDGCELNPDHADALNRRTTEIIAAALPAGSRLVYISTDQVYPDLAGPHREDRVAPVNQYGRSKRAGEMEALARPGALVVRVNFFGASRTAGRTSLSDYVVQSLGACRPTPLFADVLFSPLHMATLAEVVLDLAGMGATGVFNLGCREGASKRDFGLGVARHLSLQTATAVNAVSTDLPGRAPRPRDLRMDVAKVEACLGRSMPTLSEEIARL